MKKLSLLLSIAAFSMALQAQTKSGFVPFHDYFENQHGNIQKLGVARNIIFEEIGYSHDTYVAAAGTWTPSDSGVFYYNRDANQVWQINGTYYNFVNPTWDTTAQVIDNVDANGFVQTITGQTFNAGHWANSYEYLFTYNTSAPVGYLSTEILQNAAGTDSIGYVYTNDSIGRLLKMVVQTGSGLQNDSQYIYTYTGWNATNVITQAWVSSAWVNVYNQYNNFDANGNNTQSTGYTWSGTAWVINSQTISSYSNDNHLQTYNYYLWSPTANGGLGGYVNNYYENYQYVLDDNTEFQNYNWDTVDNAWTPVLSINYVYDNHHNVIYEQDQQYAADTFGNTDLYFYYYNSYTVSGINDLKNDLGVSIYPNPSSGSAVISLTTGVAGSITLNVYDDEGNALKHQQIMISQGLNQIPLNVAGFAAGSYYIQVTDNRGKKSVLPFIKQ